MMPTYRTEHAKQSMRAQLKQKRRILQQGTVSACSEEVVNKIMESEDYMRARTVMIYYPLQNEINLLALLKDDTKTFLFPVTHRKSMEIRVYTGEANMQKGKFGIPEPQGAAYEGMPDLAIVPAVGFDRQNYRLGRGGGYYDRFLGSLRHTRKIGVGYKFQLVDKLPHSRHDIMMDSVILADSK